MHVMEKEDTVLLGRLAERVGAALSSARRSGSPALAAVTVPLDPGLDLSAAVLSARRPTDRFTCLEQPDRDGFVLAGLGQAVTLEARGPGRFADVAARARELGRAAFADDLGEDPARPPAAGPVFVGGFAFADEGGASPEWSGLPPACLVLPELALSRQGGEARLTVSALVQPDDDAEDVVQRLRMRVEELKPSSMPLLDPDPVERTRVASATPPSHYEHAVERAIERIRAGELEKVVLAREVRAHAARDHDPAAVLGALRELFPACYCWCVGTPELAFVGASPELLVRRDGQRAQTVALAGTTRRSADPSVDDHLGEQLLGSQKDREEQAIVTRRIERTLAPVSLWVAAAADPLLVKVHNVQHLATPIRAQLKDPVPAVELAGLLLPTPAVGGEPREAALPLIPALEGLDRGWYAGAVGWTDLAEDGEFCVALRCALLRGPVAHLYAGCGIVRDSVPAEELAETEVKLQALLPLLA
ncbi:MAG: menaquinone-specific isochorismate synthase [Thermoleophilaceae bacterium]|jgi:salicylate biosynthesis isochorismate synthase/menaquinone-specific isochorismate synthase|nr:menaquinone-specific isochorismate synthase [Thermoleophilaceae bacterium]